MAIVYSCFNITAQQVLEETSTRTLRTPFPQVTYGLMWRYLHRIAKKGFSRDSELEAKIGSRMLREHNRPFADRVKSLIDPLLQQDSLLHSYWIGRRLAESIAGDLTWQFLPRHYVSGYLEEVQQRLERDHPELAESAETLPKGWGLEAARNELCTAVHESCEPGQPEQIDLPGFIHQVEKLKEANIPTRRFTCFIDLILFIDDNPTLTAHQKISLLLSLPPSFLDSPPPPLDLLTPQHPLHAAIVYIKAELAMIEAVERWHNPSESLLEETSIFPLTTPVHDFSTAWSRRSLWLGHASYGYLISPFRAPPHLEYTRLLERLTYHDLHRSLWRIHPLLNHLIPDPKGERSWSLPNLISAMIADLIKMDCTPHQLVAFYEATMTYAQAATIHAGSWFWITARLIEREVATGESVWVDQSYTLPNDQFDAVLQTQMASLGSSEPEPLRKLLILLGWLERYPAAGPSVRHHLHQIVNATRLRSLRVLMENVGIGDYFSLLALQIHYCDQTGGGRPLPSSSHRLTAPTRLTRGIFLPALFRTGLSERASELIRLSCSNNGPSRRLFKLLTVQRRARQFTDSLGVMDLLISRNIYLSEEAAICEWERLVSSTARHSLSDAQKVIEMLGNRCTPDQLLRIYPLIDEAAGRELHLDAKCSALVDRLLAGGSLGTLPPTDLLKALAHFRGNYEELNQLINQHGGSYRLFGMRLPRSEELAARIDWSLAQPHADWKMVAWKLCLLYPQEEKARRTAVRLLPSLFQEAPQERKVMLGTTWRLLCRNQLPQGPFKLLTRSSLPLVRALCETEQPEWVVIADELACEWAEKHAPDYSTCVQIAQSHPDVNRSMAILHALGRAALQQVAGDDLLACFAHLLEQPLGEGERSWLEGEALATVQNCLLSEDRRNGERIVRLIELTADHDLSRAQQLLATAEKLGWFRRQKRLFKEAMQALISGHCWHRTPEVGTVEKLLIAAVKNNAFSAEKREDRCLFLSTIRLLKDRGGYLAAHGVLALQGPFVELEEEQQVLLFSIARELASGGWCSEAMSLVERTDLASTEPAKSMRLFIQLFETKHQLDREMIAVRELRTVTLPDSPLSKEETVLLSRRLEKLWPDLKIEWSKKPIQATAWREELTRLAIQRILESFQQGNERLKKVDEERWNDHLKLPSLLILDQLAELLSLLPQREKKSPRAADCAVELVHRTATAHERRLFDPLHKDRRNKILLQTAELLARARSLDLVQKIRNQLVPIAEGCAESCKTLRRYEIDGLARVGQIDVGESDTPSLPVIRAYIRAERWEEATQQLESLEEIDSQLAVAGWLYFARRTKEIDEIEIAIAKATALSTAPSTPLEMKRWKLVQIRRITLLLMTGDPARIDRAAALLTEADPQYGLAASLPMTQLVLRHLQKVAIENPSPVRHTWSTQLLGRCLHSQDKPDEIRKIAKLIENHFDIQCDPSRILDQLVHLIEEHKLNKFLPKIAAQVAINLIRRLSHRDGSDGEADLGRHFLIWAEKHHLFDMEQQCRAEAWCLVCSRLGRSSNQETQELRILDAHDLLAYAHYKLALFSHEDPYVRNLFNLCSETVLTRMGQICGQSELLRGYAVIRDLQLSESRINPEPVLLRLPASQQGDLPSRIIIEDRREGKKTGILRLSHQFVVDTYQPVGKALNCQREAAFPIRKNPKRRHH